MYNGQVAEGLVVFAFVPVLFISGSALINNYNQYPKDNESNKTLGTVLITFGVAAYVAQLVQAPLHSQAWNKKNGFADANRSTLELEFDGTQLALCFRF